MEDIKELETTIKDSEETITASEARAKEMKAKADLLQDKVWDWGVLKYKSVPDLNVTIVEPRYLNFRGRATVIRSNFFVYFARV